MNWIAGLLVFLGFVLVLIWRKKRKRQKRLEYIDNYYFHKGIRKKLSDKYPQLSNDQLDLVFKALREYFQICYLANKKMVAMPSQVVDDAWHEFILSTRFYVEFCNKALGRFLHHTPTEAMSSATSAEQGIKRAWRLACAKENINPKRPQMLPLLFAIDGMLNIENGFVYHLNCMDANNPATASDSGYCASHIGCASGCSGDSGSDSSGFFGSSCLGSSGDSGCGSDCGGGCGGD